jgi:hypothetical protein
LLKVCLAVCMPQIKKKIFYFFFVLLLDPRYGFKIAIHKTFIYSI